MKTRDRIVYAALELFNENGERNMTTNHIAAHIDISPGNLYYHFRNKQEIVREIFNLYSAELIERFTPVQGQYESLTLLNHYLESMFALMWKYRFFYANLPDILQRDEELHTDYIAVQDTLQKNLVDIIRAFVDINLLDIAEADLQKTATTLHIVASSWLAYQSAMSHETRITEEVIHQGVLQIISVVKPTATKTGYEQLQLMEEGVKAMHA
ncbi:MULTISPECIES: TetR/AcrR family transcriptional regulator [Vibrio]|uniref:TetR family transcriptional regulator n=2 Tax=Vibrio TaxID=662 RepID=A0A7X4LND1_9VIBR|nr:MULTISPECIES: TetR/AcrR family transcriptional regulator [Vibrio]MBF9001283.1 TetR/AcrR family transcriptional regulator [Vibrio nitrifigilis]MZI94681.1 TetR family transcriptional regulator [Vibrio eleionomae]